MGKGINKNSLMEEIQRSKQENNNVAGIILFQQKTNFVCQ